MPVVKGVAQDISHCNTPAIVTGYTKDDDGLKDALTGAKVVVIPAGVPRKPGKWEMDAYGGEGLVGGRRGSWEFWWGQF